MHIPYIDKLGHPADFRVKYRFYSKDEGGRKVIPYQGLRCDFVYDNSEVENRVYMIWPEFEDEHGQVILTNDKSVPSSGTARMWVINNQIRELHCGRIKVGMKCHFWEGKITADCEVIEIIRLCANPRE